MEEAGCDMGASAFANKSSSSSELTSNSDVTFLLTGAVTGCFAGGAVLVEDVLGGTSVLKHKNFEHP